jgi:hypothetical protein
MHAQAGLFTVKIDGEEQCLAHELGTIHHATDWEHPMRRFLLSIEAAPRLLRLLSHEGIDGASMFPGADGVVRAMCERALWR